MVSPSAARIYGYGSTDEMIGIPAASLYKNPAQRHEVLQKLQVSKKITDFTEKLCGRTVQPSGCH